MNRTGRMVPQSFGEKQKNGRGQNFGVGETYGFMKFYFVSTKFYL